MINQNSRFSQFHKIPNKTKHKYFEVSVPSFSSKIIFYKENEILFLLIELNLFLFLITFVIKHYV